MARSRVSKSERESPMFTVSAQVAPPRSFFINRHSANSACLTPKFANYHLAKQKGAELSAPSPPHRNGCPENARLPAGPSDRSRG